MPPLDRLHDRWTRAAESPAQLVVWFLGLLLVLGAVYVLWATTDLRALVPEGVVVALVLLILGAAVMGAAARFGGAFDAREHSHAHAAARGPVRHEHERVSEWDDREP